MIRTELVHLGEFAMKLSKEVKNGITRREFVKNTAIKGAAAAAIGAGSMAIPVSAQSAKSTQISAPGLDGYGSARRDQSTNSGSGRT